METIETVDDSRLEPEVTEIRHESVICLLKLIIYLFTVD